jgi:hypothetical protein
MPSMDAPGCPALGTPARPALAEPSNPSGSRVGPDSMYAGHAMGFETRKEKPQNRDKREAKR